MSEKLITFADYARHGMVATMPPKVRQSAMLVHPSSFQYDRSRVIGSDVNFQCWFVNGSGDIVHNSNLCLNLVEPSTGRFVVHEIHGIPIPFKEVKGCLFQLEEGDVTHNPVMFWFEKFLAPPIRCWIPGDATTSRAYIHWQIKDGRVHPKQAATIKVGESEIRSEKDVAQSLLSKLIPKRKE